MARFGLFMHYGTKDSKKSKTEAVYFPPPGEEATPEDVKILALKMILDI
jgi:hypothetical protein